MRFIQDTEYLSCEINRFFELSMGTINCLPGAFTAIRKSTLDLVAPIYFTETNGKINYSCFWHRFFRKSDK